MRINISLRQNRFIVLFLLLSISLLIQACVSKNKTVTSYYDLGIPSPVYVEGIDLEITPFSNYSEVSSEMLYRIKSNSIDYDPNNRWAKSPNILLTSFFKNSLKIKESQEYANNKLIHMILSASVTVFDIDLQNKKTILGINYKIRYKGKTLLIQNRIFEQSFEKETPSAFASAMSLSAIELLKTICTQTEELKAVIIKENNFIPKE